MTAEPPEIIKPILINAKTAAQFCGVGLTLWKELNNTGRCPQPVKLNSKTLWVLRHLEIWALHNCPNRDSAEWQQILERELNNVN